MSTLLDLVFPTDFRSRPRPVTADGLSPTQERAVRALAARIERPERVFYGLFGQWGLPETRREWRALAAGHAPAPVDPAAPMLADLGHPDRAVRPGSLVPGQRIRHRVFGAGTVVDVMPQEESEDGWTDFVVEFDEEGTMRLSFPSDGSPLRPR